MESTLLNWGFEGEIFIIVTQTYRNVVKFNPRHLTVQKNSEPNVLSPKEVRVDRFFMNYFYS